ncbi:MAG: MMPL family transporter, partial [Deltaproteobacteria bacterium]|nr:MMPL family transporter [Deltaproteobacteria bacterium]
MLQNLLPKYAHWLIKRWKSFLIFCFFLSLTSILVSLFFLKSQTGILDLYSPEEPVAKRFIEYVEKFGAAQTLVIVAEGSSAQERRQAIESLVQILKKQEADKISDFFYKINLDFYRQHALQWMEESKVKELLKELDSQDSSLDQLLKSENFNDYLQLLEKSFQKKPSGAILDQNLNQMIEQAFKPLAILAKQIKEAQTLKKIQYELESNPNDNLDELGYLSSQNPPLHVLLIKPKDLKQDHKLDRILIKEIRSYFSQLQKQYPQVKLAMTGGPALNHDQFEISEQDMRWASVLAFLSTGLLFFLAFHSFWRPALGLLSLAASITWTFGLTTLTVGHLNMFSLAFMVILIGQGTYYGVHVVARYEEELKKGKDVDQALQATICGIFPNISTSTLTTAAAFFATMLVPLKGFAELGWIAGCGILLSSLSMQMLLPCLLKLYDRKGVQFKENKKLKIKSPQLLQKIS